MVPDNGWYVSMCNFCTCVKLPPPPDSCYIFSHMCCSEQLVVTQEHCWRRSYTPKSIAVSKTITLFITSPYLLWTVSSLTEWLRLGRVSSAVLLIFTLGLELWPVGWISVGKPLVIMCLLSVHQNLILRACMESGSGGLAWCTRTGSVTC